MNDRPIAKFLYIDEDRINEDLNYIVATLLMHKGFDFDKDKTETGEKLKFENNLLMKSNRWVSFVYRYSPDKTHGEDILSLLPEYFGRDVRELKRLIHTLYREYVDAIMIGGNAENYCKLYEKTKSSIDKIMRKYNYILTVRSI